jgi:hypothetical protein
VRCGRQGGFQGLGVRIQDGLITSKMKTLYDCRRHPAAKDGPAICALPWRSDPFPLRACCTQRSDSSGMLTPHTHQQIRKRVNLSEFAR